VIGEILGIIGGGLKLAEHLAAKARDAQLISAGEAEANAANWKLAYETLERVKKIDDWLERNPAAARSLRDHFTSD